MKSANIFLYKDQTAKLGDLNVSKVAKKGLLYTQTGTPYYASPEVWKDKPYDLKSDIWSLGCVTYEMCALVPPFRADDMNGLFKRVLKGQYPPIPSHFSMDMRMLIKTLLQVQPSTRPNTEQILEMPIVVKRIKKYFPGKESYFVPGLFEMQEETPEIGNTDSQLLRTIKLSKNVFKLSLPEATYAIQNANFATIPGSQAFQNGKSRSTNQSKSPGGMKMQTINNITKTTAITNSKQSIQSGSKLGVDDLTSANVALPNIKGSKKNRLAAVDDDEEEYDDRVPQKPKNLRRTPTEDGSDGANVGSNVRHRRGDHVSATPGAHNNGKSSSIGAISGKHSNDNVSHSRRQL